KSRIAQEEFEGHIHWYLSLPRFANLPHDLKDRLINTAIFRRMMLQYRQRHQEKLNQGIPKLPTVQAEKSTDIATPSGLADTFFAMPQPELKPETVQPKHYSRAGPPLRSNNLGGSAILSNTNASSVNKKTRSLWYEKSIITSNSA